MGAFEVEKDCGPAVVRMLSTPTAQIPVRQAHCYIEGVGSPFYGECWSLFASPQESLWVLNPRVLLLSIAQATNSLFWDNSWFLGSRL